MTALTVCCLLVLPAPDPADAAFSRTQIGDREESASAADYNEFTNQSSDDPVFVVGSDPVASLRPWIGRSTCGGCSTPKYQRLRLNDLVPGEQYVVAVHPSYLTGESRYSAQITDGAGDVYFGAEQNFRQQGYFNAPETWRIEFVPSTTSVTLRLGNNAAPGANYLYFDWLIAAPKTLRVLAANQTARIGGRQLFGPAYGPWDEFGATPDPRPEHTVGSNNLSTVRPWIGHSACGSCGPGTTKVQRFKFTNLTPGETYWLTAYPANVTGTAYYTAWVSEGQGAILEGQYKHFNGASGWLNPLYRWAIRFRADSSQISLTLGNGLTSGNHYLYMNWYDFQPGQVGLEDVSPQVYSQRAHALDNHNGGNWWKDDVVLPNGSYAWDQGYVMSSYVDFYRQTLDEEWLRKLVEHADSILSQRASETPGLVDCYGESPPAWIEEGNPAGSGYAWVGFTGAMFDPMVDFAAMVLQSPRLSSQTFAWLPPGTTLEDKAMEYVQEFQRAVDYHESEWVTHNQLGSFGWYKFQPNLCVNGNGPLRDKPVAWDMGSLMMGAVLRLSDAYRALGDPRGGVYMDRAARYARYFRSSWRFDAGGDYYWWCFADYYPCPPNGGGNPDDIGHANFNVRFIATSFREGLSFTRTDVQRVANAYARLIQSDYSIFVNLMTGGYASNVSPFANTAYLWHHIAPYKPGLSNSAYGHARLAFTGGGSEPIVSFASLAYADYLDRH